MEPGPELAVALESIDPSELNGHELVIVLQARSRQIAHLQAQLYTEMWELPFTPAGDAGSPPVRTELLDEFASDEIAAAPHPVGSFRRQPAVPGPRPGRPPPGCVTPWGGD